MRHILELNEKWAFSKETKNIPDKMPINWVYVKLPHTWNEYDGWDGGDDYYRGTCIYAKELNKSDLPENEMYYLEINGANSNAYVYINGKLVDGHRGGYSAFRMNVTDYLTEDNNLLVITVDNSPSDMEYPQMADFTFYGGLYRDVRIIGVEKTHFCLDYCGCNGVKITPKVIEADCESGKCESCSTNNANVYVNVCVTEPRDNQKIHFVIKSACGNVVAEKYEMLSHDRSDVNTELKISDIHLWDGLRDPYRYILEMSIIENDMIIDVLVEKFGCRTFKIDANKGFILNGRAYPLRGVSRHQDRKYFGNALPVDKMKEDMELIREMGANSIRLAHYQHAKEFYDLCDEYGMVVWAEIPYISKHLPNGVENTMQQMEELIMQNFNHPSIVVWGLSNEITMAGNMSKEICENHTMLNELCHRLDDTRPTTIAVVSMCDINDPYIQIPDTVAYNHYFGWYGGEIDMNGPWFDDFHNKFPDVPIGVSEYGCEGLDWHTSEPMQGDYTEEYQALYHREVIKQFYKRNYLWCTYVWNMFDFGADARSEGGEPGQNHKGLVTFDRAYKKDAFYAYKAWLSDEPFVHIGGKRYVDRVEDVTKVMVYSNLTEVELFANGRSVGKKRSEDHFFEFNVENIEKTRLEARGYGSVCNMSRIWSESINGLESSSENDTANQECVDFSLIRKVDAFEEKYRLKEKSAVLNWFDITKTDNGYSLNDKISDIMKSDEGKECVQIILRATNQQENSFAGMQMDDNMMKMMGGFTLLRFLNLMATTGKKWTKEELLDINGKLNKIKRV